MVCNCKKFVWLPTYFTFRKTFNKMLVKCHTCRRPTKKGNVRKIDVQSNSLHRVLCLKQGHGGFFLFNDPYLYIILLINYIYRVGEHLDRHIPFCCFDHQAPGRCISTCKDFKSYLFPAKQYFSFLYHSWLNSHNKIDLQSVQPFSL